MASFLIKINDVLMGLFVVLIVVAATISAPGVGPVLGIIAGAIIGTWYVLSGIYWNTKK